MNVLADFVCPVCYGPLELAASDLLRCASDDLEFPCLDGIWRFLDPRRIDSYRDIIQDYEAGQLATGRRGESEVFLRALPFVGFLGELEEDWQLRAQSYRTLTRRLLSPVEMSLDRALNILDLGAGNGWLSYRAAGRGHHAFAIDLLINRWDGLGAHTCYDLQFTPMQADFDNIPIRDCQADIAVFNNSLHFSSDYETTLREALRVLAPDGLLVIMDTPFFEEEDCGRALVARRMTGAAYSSGNREDGMFLEGFLTSRRLDALGDALQIRWNYIDSDSDWRQTLRSWTARLQGDDCLLASRVIVGRRQA
ncbi:MAG: methyltransferase domain-containing protein [Chloroflexota bacterium]|nr:methyltransferase domain-containing protein [Chloroflexota bacterium]